MTIWRDLLDAAGINPSLVIAGFSGGTVQALWMRSKTAMGVVATVVTGMMVANYLGDLVSKMTNFPPLPIGFLVGYLGVSALQRLGAIVQQYMTSSAGGAPPPAANQGTPRDA